MEAKQEALVQTMAFLMSILPDTTLGKLLNFCLAAKVDADIADKTAIEMARELLANPANLAYWAQEVMEGDFENTVAEWKALTELDISADQFPESLRQELQDLDW